MKKYNSIFLTVGFLLTMLLSGCSDDKEEITTASICKPATAEKRAWMLLNIIS